jgi:hypothetical protein
VMRELYNDTCDPSFLTPPRPPRLEKLTNVPWQPHLILLPPSTTDSLLKATIVIPKAYLRVREGFKSE